MDIINTPAADAADHPPLSEEQVISNLQQESDLSDQYYAAWGLGRMRSRHHQTVPLLLKTLQTFQEHPDDQDRRGVALNAIRSLGWLQETSTSDILSGLLRSNDYGIREAAARSRAGPPGTRWPARWSHGPSSPPRSRRSRAAAARRRPARAERR